MSTRSSSQVVRSTAKNYLSEKQGAFAHLRPRDCVAFARAMGRTCGEVPPGEVFKTRRGNTIARAGHGRVVLLGGLHELELRVGHAQLAADEHDLIQLLLRRGLARARLIGRGFRRRR